MIRLTVLAPLVLLNCQFLYEICLQIIKVDVLIILVWIFGLMNNHDSLQASLMCLQGIMVVVLIMLDWIFCLDEYNYHDSLQACFFKGIRHVFQKPKFKS